MSKRRTLISHPLKPRGRSRRFGNIALVPASQLPYRATWQAIANGLPPGNVLFVVPARETLMKERMRRVAATLQSQGYRLSAIISEIL